MNNLAVQVNESLFVGGDIDDIPDDDEDEEDDPGDARGKKRRKVCRQW